MQMSLYRCRIVSKHTISQQYLSINQRVVQHGRMRNYSGSVKVNAASYEAVVTAINGKPVEDFEDQEYSSIVACPICQTTTFDLFNPDKKGTKLSCDICKRSFEANNDFTDLTVTSGYQATTYQEQQWAGTQLFRSPLVSFAYERGWRQNFARFGAPGPDAEFDKAMEYLRDVKGGTLLDVSCGSGLFTRRFLTSQQFNKVIAIDFSESMLRETKQRIQNQSASQYIDDLQLIRADVGRLPFKSSSFSAIYSGAAIHCWPSPQQAFTEISRILKPGGVFVASTFLYFFLPFEQILGDEVVGTVKRFTTSIVRNPSFNFFIERDLKDLAESVGLENFQSYKYGRFILFSVSKPKST